MEREKKVVRLELTEDQRAKLWEETGREPPAAIELEATELEERIAPWWIYWNGGW